MKLREAGNDRSLLDSFAAAADDFIQSREFERKQQVCVTVAHLFTASGYLF